MSSFSECAGSGSGTIPECSESVGNSSTSALGLVAVLQCLRQLAVGMESHRMVQMKLTGALCLVHCKRRGGGCCCSGFKHSTASIQLLQMELVLLLDNPLAGYLVRIVVQIEMRSQLSS